MIDVAAVPAPDDFVTVARPMTLAVLSFATRKTPGRVMLRCDELALDEARDLEPSPPFARWTGAYESGYWTREALLGIGLAIGTWLEGPQRWLSRLAQATAPVILVIETTRTPDPIEQAALDAPWELIACATSERESRAFAPPQGDESVPAPVEELLQQLGPVDWQNVQHLAFEPSVLLSVVRRLGKSAAPLEPSKYRLSVVFMPCQPDGSAGISVNQARAIGKASDSINMYLEVEDSGSLHGLCDLIAQLGDYDVLHVSCPATMAPFPALAFEGAQGERVDVSADDIWSQVGHMPRLAVVSAYGESAPGSAFTSRWAQNASAVAVASGVLGPLSMQLCQRGWPAVIGLAGTTAAQAEIDFVAALYRLLSQRTSLLDAFARALRVIEDAAAGTLWHRARLVLGPRGGGPVVEGADVHPGISHLNQSRQFLDPNGQIPIATDYQTSLHRRALQKVVAILRNAAFPAVAIHGSDERSRATFVSRVLRCMRPTLRRVVLTANFDAPAIVRTIRDQTAHSEIADLVKKSQGKLREDPSQLQHVLRAIVEGPCRDGGSAFVLVLHDFEPAPGSDDLVVLRALLGAFAGANTASRLLITCRVRFPAVDEEGIDISQRLAWQSLDMVTRFFNETRAATAVRNSGIVEVYDFGMLKDRSTYIIMEYLEGENLGARLRHGRMPVAATMTIVRAIARALQALHDQGIVHRDLKPDNILLVPDPELASGERVKLLDFGFAKLAPVSGEISQTRTGMVMGTPTYMAPEQCRGAGSVDHRADLYALGCVAYQMMCGEPPFVSDGAGDLIARHLYFAPQPMRSLVPEIPAEVDGLVLRLLEKDPAARPATAFDLIRTIDHLASVSVPGVMQTQPPTRLSAAGVAPIVDTTLRGAASTVALFGAPPKPRRTPLIVGLATGLIAVAAALAIVLRSHDDEAHPTPRPVVAAPADREPPSPPPARPATPAAAPVVAPPAPESALAAVLPVGQASTVVAALAPIAADPPDLVRKKRSSSASWVARDEPKATAAATEPEPSVPAPASGPPVAQPPASEPPPAEPPHEITIPAATPAVAAKAPPLVSVTAVSKRSGEIPAIRVSGDVGEFTDVVVKLCIDDQGAVSSAKVVKAPAGIAEELQRSLRGWLYAPYVNPTGVASAACFPLSFRVVFKN